MSYIFNECFNRDVVVEIYSYMKGVLSEERLNHSISTALFAEYLCMHYGLFKNSNKCFFAGLVHDIAREYDYEHCLDVLSEEGIDIEEWEKKRPVLLHGKVGAVILERDFGIRDREVLDAVATHVTGKAGMGVLSKIVFVADYLEPLRGFVSQGERRAVLNTSLDEAVRLVLDGIFSYLKKEGKPVAPSALSLYRELNGVRA